MSNDVILQRLDMLNEQLDAQQLEMQTLIATKDIINNPEGESEFNALSELIYQTTREIESIVSALN